MANGANEKTIFGPDLSLSLDQQSLLRTALSSNNPSSSPKRNSSGLKVSSTGSGAGSLNGNAEPAPQFTSPQSNSLYQSPIQGVPGSGIGNLSADESPFLDGYELEDGNFDWEGNGEQLFGDLPGANEDDLHDKRKASGEGDEADGKNKRHEGNEKNNKKPGRKPLNSSEPTTVCIRPLFVKAPV